MCINRCTIYTVYIYIYANMRHHEYKEEEFSETIGFGMEQTHIKRSMHNRMWGLKRFII